ncbi:MAG: sensor histidine kinase [Sphingomonadaceae bacterium]
MEFITPLLPDTATSLGIALVVSSNTPLVLLGGDLVVVAASSSFCSQFGLIAANVVKRSLFELGNGEWNIPQLRALLRATAAGDAEINSYECDLVRAARPALRLVVHAHRLDVPEHHHIFIVLALADVTELRKAETLKKDLIRDKQNLLDELQHRVANSLQIIASILMQSAQRVRSHEASLHIQDAHHRVMSIATLQRMLAAGGKDRVALAIHLTDLCASIAASMISNPEQMTLVASIDGSWVTADESVSIGLIVTELVINALKHGYPDRKATGAITVTYQSAGAGWVLSVKDDGIGMPDPSKRVKPGLGTGIVEALASQLDATIAISDAGPGTLITIAHDPDTSLPRSTKLV